MKKQLKKLLILIISIFTIPIIAKADMGFVLPSTYHYEVIITNPNGAYIYDWDGKKTAEKIPYDTKITIDYEETINGELYIEIDGSGGMIKFSDTKLYSTEIDFSKLDKNTAQIQYYTIEDTQLYKGPSTVYGKIENITIPANTTLDYEYETGNSQTQWIYTEYNGIKGWVYTLAFNDLEVYNIKCTVAVKSPGTLLVFGDQDVFDNKGNIIGKVKNFEEYKYIYYRLSGSIEKECYIKSDKIEGWIKLSNNLIVTKGASIYDENTYLTMQKEGIELFEDYGLEKKVNDLKIPYGTEYNTFYCISTGTPHGDSFGYDNIVTTCQVEYNNKKYWINEDFNELIYTYEFTITTKEEFQMYKYIDDTESLNVTIPSDVNLATKWKTYSKDEENGYWYYVEYENQKGWIYINTENSDTVVEDNQVNSTEEVETEYITTDAIEGTEDDSLTPKQTAYIAIGTAALLAVGALFTILLINKNKKNKKENEEKIVEEATPVVEETKEPKETDNETK